MCCDCTMKYLIQAAHRPRHLGLVSHPRYIIMHHSISRRNTPGNPGGAPHPQIFFFSNSLFWQYLPCARLKPRLDAHCVENQGFGPAGYWLLPAQLSKASCCQAKNHHGPRKTSGISLGIQSQGVGGLCWAGLGSSAPCKTHPSCKHGHPLVTDKV